MRRLIVSCLALTAMSGCALAADLLPTKKTPAPLAAPAFSWSGAYIGGDIGGTWGVVQHTFDFGVPGGVSNLQGLIGGGYAGYNFQSGPYVAGVEADLQGSGASGGYANLTGVTSAGNARMNWEGAIRGRLGYSINRVLFFAAGGLAFGGFRYGGGPDFGPQIPCCGFSDTSTGVTVGAGLEYAITNNVIGRVEYRYNQFSASSGGLAPFFPIVTMNANNDNYNEVRAGLAYKF